MTQARRALGPRRRNGVWILIAVPLALLVAGTLIVLGIRRQADSGALPIPLESIRQASPVASDSTPSPTPQESKSPHNPRAATALKACRAKVRAADKVLAVGRHGMRHWSEHLQAQTDAFAGKITVGKMDDIFDRTRKAGDQDENRYTKRSSPTTANTAHAAPSEVLAPSSATNWPVAPSGHGPSGPCSPRRRTGWRTGRSISANEALKAGRDSQSPEEWLQTWRAAPPHIKAYKKPPGLAAQSKRPNAKRSRSS